MENIIVGLIVAAALAFSVRGLVRIFKGKGGCGCAKGCNCSSIPKKSAAGST